MSSSPTATAASVISTSKPQPTKKRGSRSSGDQRKAAPPAASSNKRPRARKERLGERILALQQLVSPFGKVLSSPYMQRLPPPPSPAPLPEEPRAPNDLRSRGLCLVPVSCTDHVAGGNANGADVWSSVPAMGMPATAEEEYAVAAGMLRGDRDHHPRQLA
ncbi:unnamed protein product [Triticum turgidum subsp. durum]|uniref:Uncharacterized protein n=1 Tax=Triticum turgidum subsp. durum TaxID=4567 RepID=A0A9R0U165_TRITD|nr:unnamed protein product [Triticum turgidum subsp. durum]